MYPSIYIYIYIYTCIHLYIYIYIYIVNTRERERKNVCISRAVSRQMLAAGCRHETRCSNAAGLVILVVFTQKFANFAPQNREINLRTPQITRPHCVKQKQELQYTVRRHPRQQVTSPRGGAARQTPHPPQILYEKRITLKSFWQ